MTSGRDDEALNWDGDDDPTLVTSGAEPVALERVASEPFVVVVDDVHDDVAMDAEPPSLPEGWNAVGRGSETVIDETAVESAPVPHAVASGTTNVALIATGVLAGVYLLYAIGWLIGGLRLQGRAMYLVTDVMYQGSLWLAAFAPVVWFATVLFTTRRSHPWVRYVWLAAGAVLLVPWPFIMIGAVGL